eukprot:CAMPEP_0181451070 /NCGR_PEP_ID=MMETSP1110-20121109/28500_1 /TAXON_ID=174948 /ORGANISM="Symbiodinium sp., Strain CCMP421" /LENGTH=108 /DNA_ID=CAMNT_0023575307 /DNA_START=57 /DNA_END=383 /DNA_ORIENTATION=+
MAQDLMCFDPKSPVHGDKVHGQAEDLLSSFDPLTGASGSASHSDGAARVQLPDKVAAAFAAPAQSTVATLTPEQQREQMMRAVQEDAQRMHQQCGKEDVEDPFKGLEK